MTRRSFPIARIILRRDSAFWAAASDRVTRPIFVTPSTRWATESPKRSRTSSSVAIVSSTVSWRSPVVTVSSSRFQSARRKATFSGWTRYGSPDLRT